jgi:hypothetical protein
MEEITIDDIAQWQSDDEGGEGLADKRARAEAMRQNIAATSERAR